jgi:hypothetical protein
MQQDGLRDWFAGYLDVFAACGRGEAAADALLDYLAPPLLVSSDGGLTALANATEIVAWITGAHIEPMLAAGYHHTEEVTADIRVLNRTTALYTADLARVAAGGEDLGRLTATYLITEREDERRIAALVLHG